VILSSLAVDDLVDARLRDARDTGDLVETATYRGRRDDPPAKLDRGVVRASQRLEASSASVLHLV